MGTGNMSSAQLSRSDIANIIAERGADIAHGLRGVRRELGAMDKNGNKFLERPEFDSALRSCGINMTDFEMDETFRHFDYNADGSIHYDEFLTGIRKPLSAQRMLHVRKVFNTLDSNNNNVAYLADVANGFNAAATPQAYAGVSPDAVLEDFLSYLDSKKISTNGLVAFCDYYADVGHMMPNDADFAAMLEACWGISASGIAYTELLHTSNTHGLKPRRPEPLPEYVPMVRLPDHLDPNLSTMTKTSMQLNTTKPINPCLANTSGGAIYNLEAPVKRAPDLTSYHTAELRPDLLARFPERGGLDPGVRISETKEQYTGKPFPPRIAQSTWKAEDSLMDITREYEELANAPLMTTDPLEVSQFNYQTTSKGTYVDPTCGVEVGTPAVPKPADRLRGGFRPRMDTTFKSMAQLSTQLQPQQKDLQHAADALDETSK